MKKVMASGQAVDEPVVAEEPKEEVAHHHEFPEQSKEPFLGLLFLGFLEDQFEYAGHDFVMKTLTDGEYLQVSLLMKQYNDTLGADIAYKAGVIALSLVRVDGRELYSSLSSSETASVVAHAKFDTVVKWSPHVVSYLYTKYLELDKAAVEVLKALGETSGESN